MRNAFCTSHKHIITFGQRNILNTVVRAVAFATFSATTSTFVLSHKANSRSFTSIRSLAFSGSLVVSNFGTRSAAAAPSDSTAFLRSDDLRQMSSSSLLSSNSDDMNRDQRPLEALCVATLQACEAVTPAVEALYRSINNSDNSCNEKTKTKADDSIFTIADGLVQHLLIEGLLGKRLVGEIVGEEDCPVNLTSKPYRVDDLVVPSEFEEIIDEAISGVSQARDTLMTSSPMYSSLTAFIDPIDGTREFSTQKGDQCTICVGYADTNTGHPVAGVVYRPLSSPSRTWAMGAKSEGFKSSNLMTSSSSSDAPERGSLLTTNGRISPFLESLMKELDYERTPSGGAGNKMLLLLEGKGSAYIQDRGVSRWDTCGAQAVLEAHGGILCRLDRFLDNEDVSKASYTYRKTVENLDFSPGLSFLTKYNAADEVDLTQGLANSVSEVKPYANLCGLLALGEPENNPARKTQILQAIKKAAQSCPPAFD